MAVYKSLVKKLPISPDKKTKQKEYLPDGLLPIVDQGRDLVGGYANNMALRVACHLPVIVFGDHTKAVKYIDFPFGAGADGIKVLEPKEGVFPKFLYYATQYLVLRLEDKGYARHYQHLEKKELAIPSLDEQNRIVARIEELFSELDKAVETLQTTKQQLAVYRQAVLMSCIGEGTFLPISECIEEMGQGWSPKCERKATIDEKQWAVITTTAVQPMHFDYTENKTLPSTLKPKEQHELRVGDVLITRAGPRSRCGICCMVREAKPHLLNCDKVYRIRTKGELLLPEYLEVVLNAPAFQKEIAFCKTGGNDSGVNLTQSRFLKIAIPVPSIPAQKEILVKIETRLSVYDSIEKTIDTALAQAEALRQSILKKAFEGEI